MWREGVVKSEAGPCESETPWLQHGNSLLKIPETTASCLRKGIRNIRDTRD